jgi:hypothetical protein
MKHFAVVLSVTGFVLMGDSHQSDAAQLNTMGEVGRAIQACWNPPAEAKDASVTLSFSFRRDGTLIGSPRPTKIKIDGDDRARKAFVDAAIAAVQGCAPLQFSSKLAEGIAGQVFTMPFSSQGNDGPPAPD